MPSDAPRFVYITAPSREQAVTIGRTLVEERLAASINVLPGVRSIYRWQGRLQEADEAVLVAKTRAGLAGRLIERVKSLHSYACPGIVLLPILEGNPEYLTWLEIETKPEEAR